jgi:hypothetical protein
MPINVEIKVVQFGQIRLEIGKHVSPVEEYKKDQVREIVRYREPQETSSRGFEVQYDEELTSYIVPQTTG